MKIRQGPLFLLPLTVLFCANLSAVEYLWEQPQATVLPQGDLAWNPEPFAYEAAGDIRYIDYANGDDANAGTRQLPWKHHPWDPNATGQAKAGKADTYVFKGGVIYRGHLVVPDGTSGSEGQPIRLTRDPDWGDGPAWIYGSETVSEWSPGSPHPNIPSAEKVWTAKLDYAPRALWMVERDGETTRIPLARTPNWEVSDPRDPLSEWWVWENPQWWKHGNETRAKGVKHGLYGIDTENLTEDADYYEGATVRTEWGIVMSNPMPSVVERFYPEDKAIGFGTPFLGPGRIIRGQRYFLEDKPHYLDQAGEYFFEKQGQGGTLHLRLPGDIDPRQVTIEAPRHINLIDADSANHLQVSGLGFRFCNYRWNHADFKFMHEDMLGAAVRVLGGGENIEVSNCTFEHVNRAVRIEGNAPDQDLDRIVISDNDIRYCDQAGITVRNHAPRQGETEADFGRLINLHILRNRLHEINLRNVRMDHVHAIDTMYPELAVIAGNFISRTWGGGIQIVAAKGDGQPIESPLVRLHVFNNRTEETLLAACDWGAIRVVQGGSGYIYNNVVRDPGGFSHWRYKPEEKKGTPRFGFAYYLDGAYKHYAFNNIAWSPNNELGSKYANESAFQTLISFENQVFNNSAYRFVDVTRNQSPQLGRWHYLGNIYQDISGHVFRLGNPPKQEDQNQADVVTSGSDHDLATFAIANNVFHDIRGDYGLFIDQGTVYEDPEAMRTAMQEQQLLASDLGVVSEVPPLTDPANMDFRPNPASAAIDRGVRYFVPWGLYATVGEWHFRRSPANPDQITDHHWFMQQPYGWRGNYIDMPRWPLQAPWADTDSYEEGPLEDWIPSALTFTGQPAVVPQAELEKEIHYTPRRSKESKSIPASSFKTADMDTNSFLVEIVFQATQPGGTLVEKASSGLGYQLSLDEQSRPVFTLGSGGQVARLTGSNPLGDGWHHLLAEADRANGELRFYLDGKPVAETALDLPAEASLANDAPLLIGKDFHGAIDFLRISRGTLADAHTTIEELYAWQFDGPFLKDFAGKPRNFETSPAGALDF